ncbi:MULTISPECIES: Lrp/AsnC family transcriptional regulator [Sphingomonas]|uniref:Lrp/AsnC family transcriptional regulator n=1 Tax=Sphingomonas TaxID=13687 RepID=UPI00092B0500|nr:MULTISPECIES: Lrp/AsnC family transcriptional regulator [Sphingomonas]MCW6531013.1 Lrp/AsnC family transcriptional regulator [Sphingomonas lycopersici]OJU22263.1 MAG: AsnC family transcriptional regulator [Sphingomonas sp. 66-10]
MTAPTLDQLDRQLIDILAHDARVSNRKIAADLGVTEGTVRGRIKRLQQDGLIAFTAITSLRLEDSVKLAIIGVQAEYARLRPIAEQIAAFPNVDAVMIAMGRFNILVVCLFSELDRLYALASDQILVIDGVHHVETSIAVKTVKYNSRVVRIAEAERVVDADGG